MGADDTWKYEDEPEEPEAVKGSDGALRRDPVHRFEPRHDVSAETKQPHDITENELQ
jgi:hypothetical protein